MVMHRRILHDWSDYAGYFCIKKAIDLLEELWVDYMQNGKVNPGAGIFLGKNLFGYKDVADVVVTPNNPMQGMDADAARKRLIDAIPDEDDE